MTARESRPDRSRRIMAGEDARLRSKFEILSAECAARGLPSRAFGEAWLIILREEDIDRQCRAATHAHFLHHALGTFESEGGPEAPPPETSG